MPCMHLNLMPILQIVRLQCREDSSSGSYTLVPNEIDADSTRDMTLPLDSTCDPHHAYRESRSRSSDAKSSSRTITGETLVS